MLGKKLCPALQVCGLRLIEGHCFAHAHFSPEDERAKLSRMGFEPDVLLRVGASHSVRKPMIELARRLFGTCRITISRQDCVFLESVTVRGRSWFDKHARDASILPGARAGSGTVQNPLDLSMSILRQCCAETIPTNSISGRYFKNAFQFGSLAWEPFSEHVNGASLIYMALTTSPLPSCP